MKPYTDYIRRLTPGALAAALIVCAGCSDDFGKMNGNGYETYPSDCIAFTTHLAPGSRAGDSGSTVVGNVEIAEEQWPFDMTPEDSVASRGALSNHLDGEAGVIGFQYTDNDFTGISTVADNSIFEFDGDRLVSKGFIIPWKTITEPYLDIYAYAPYVSATAGDGVQLDLTTVGQPKITYDYKVPENIADQKDIIVASRRSTKSGDDYGKTIALVFDHALSAVRFRVGFDCTVKSVAINNVYNHGTYNFPDGKWTIVERSDATEPNTVSYKLDFSKAGAGRTFKENEFLAKDKTNIEYMILMPQTLPENAEIVLTCDNKEYKAEIGGKLWAPGKRITYTFHKNHPAETIYFDLAAGDVTIDAEKAIGSVYRNEDGNGDKNKIKTQTIAHVAGNHYYVYQSTEANREGIWTNGVCTPPKYERVKGPDGRPWAEYIINNTDVNAVISAWSKPVEGVCNDKVATDVGRSGTEHKISIRDNVTCDLTIDNIYSTYQQASTSRVYAGISFIPTGTNAKVTVNIVGDNRLGAIHYNNRSADNKNEIIFEGSGSLTVADVDGKKVGPSGSNGLTEGTGYFSNFWDAAIGGNDDFGEGESNGIVINSGIIFAGTTKAENCTAIGGGGNEYGKVIINGGVVTAVATTTGTAIGGGIGFGNPGGKGDVFINGGNVYAYNFKNKWDIPSSAIGGAGARTNYGEVGNVTITGGYVYALSEGGTAIGGGSSYRLRGGAANVTITGGAVFAKTGSPISTSIGGGTACTEGNENSAVNGGDATIRISGNPIIRTGSIGGGGTNAGKGKIGFADIIVDGGDMQAQFILEAGTTRASSFTLKSGTIRNSDTSLDDYYNVKKDGGAVWLQNGTVSIEGGTIRNCKAARGGAIYINGFGSSAIFTMSGGTIEGNDAVRDNGTGSGDSADDFAGSGGAVYIVDGTVTLTGGSILKNLAAGGHGGGVFIRRGSLTIDGAEIRDNASEVRKTETSSYAGGDGGGVYVYSNSEDSDVDVSLSSGTISGNTADRKGGGLCVIQGNAKRHANITIGTENGSNDGLQITGNRCLQQGGGLYARGVNANITINSGTIKGNRVSQYVHNQDVANDQGSVTLNGGDVDYRVVTFNANNGSGTTSTQKIVTETNSLLKAPAFTRLGYKLVGWNTKPGGSGSAYTDGQIMNINKDITLYAQWELATL